MLAGRSPPFLSRDRAAISVYVDRERRSLRYHECDLQSRREKTEVSAATRPNLANPRTSPVMAAPTPREAKRARPAALEARVSTRPAPPSSWRPTR